VRRGHAPDCWCQDCYNATCQRSNTALTITVLSGFGLLALLAALVLAVGCALPPSRPEIPAPAPGPRPPSLLTLHVQVVDVDGPPVANATVEIQDGVNAGNGGTTNARGQVFLNDLRVAGQTLCAEAAGYERACVPVTLLTSQNATIRLHKAASPAPVRVPTAGRVRVVDGRLQTDRGWWNPLGLADFDLIHLARIGQRATVLERLDKAEVAKVGVVRVFASAKNLFHLTPDMAGFEEAWRFVQTEANARGIYVLLCVLPDAAHLYPTEAERERILRKVLAQIGPGVIVQLQNEPWNSHNGYSSAADLKLLQLATIAAQVLGHRDFIIGDPKDGDDLDASAETVAEAKVLARHSNILALHSSRKGGANVGADGRLRRWVDHLEGFFDVVSAASSSVGRKVFGVHDEAMGHASIQFVPLPNGGRYEREWDPDVAIAAGMTARLSGLLYVYHRIAQQNDGTPGLEQLGALIAQIPAGPECSYRNDSWTGAPSRGFSWNQKVRHWVCGNRAWTLAYGLDRTGTITFVDGWRVVKTLYESPADESGAFARSKVWVGEVAK
jgi:hypothetical protein